MSLILSVCHELPRPDRAAGDRRYVAVLELLARRHRVDLFAARHPSDGAAYVRQFERAGVRVVPPNLYGWLRTVLRTRRYDIGLFEFWRSAAEFGPLFREHQPWAKLVVDSVDIHFAREEAGVALGHNDADAVAANRRREVAAYRESDGVIVVTPEDRALLHAVGMSESVYTIPVVVPLRSRPVTDRRAELLFVGGFKHAPNVDGLLWFVSDVWPAVRTAVPAAALTVVGSHPSPEILALHTRNGITVEGFVPDTGPYLDRAAVSIAPLRYGAGMKGKVTEALCSGVPVVTTTVGAQGFGLVSGEHALIADAPTDFAAAVVRLLTDAGCARRLGEGGQKLIAEQCTPEVVGGAIETMIADLIAGVRRPLPGARWLCRAASLRLRSALHGCRQRARGVLGRIA